MAFFTGTPEQNYQQSLLNPSQQRLQQQLINQAQTGGQQLGGYYDDLFNENGQNYNALSAPIMRQFREDIVPGLAEQFAGMGAGGLSSSGFRNAAVSAGTDLSERLGALRAQLRQQGAQGLQSLYYQGLQPTMENIHRPATGGFLDAAGPLAGQLAGSFLGPVGAAAGGALGSMASNWISGKGKSDPYGGSLNQLNQQVFSNQR